MRNVFLLGLLVASSVTPLSALASDWQVTYFGHPAGRLFIDKDSIEGKDSVKKFWTLYAPLVKIGEPGEGFAYSKTMRQIDCKERTAATMEVIFYDEKQAPHDSEVRDKSMRNIVPDSETDYLWKYVCKGDPNGMLANSAGSMAKFLADQAQFTRENAVQAGRVQER